MELAYRLWGDYYQVVVATHCNTGCYHTHFVVNSVSFDDGSRSVPLSFTDEGAEFNPLSHADPDTALSADDRPIGGLGILMVKNLADEVSYERVGGRNILKAKIIQKAASTEKPQLREV